LRSNHTLVATSEKAFYYLAFFSTLIFLVFFKSPHDHFGDNGVYVAAGQRIIDFLPVYEPVNGFRAGSFSAVTLYFFSVLFGDVLGWILLQFCNIFGCFYFFKILCKRLDIPNFVFFMICLLFTAPMREMLHTHQFTGIILGGSLLSLTRFNSKAATLSQIFLLGFLMDLKPHLVFPLIVFLAIQSRMIKKLMYAFLFNVAAHILINVYRGEILEYQWLEVILRNGSSSESLNFWNYLEVAESLQIPFLLLQIGVSFFVFAFALLRVRNGAYAEGIFWVGVTAYLLPYNHLYDLVLLVGVSLLLTFSRPSIIGIIFAIFVFLPQEIDSFSNSAYLICLGGIYLLHLRRYRLLPDKWFIAILGLVVIHSFNYFFLFKQDLSMVSRTSEIVFLSLLVGLNYFYSNYFSRVKFFQNRFGRD
jgi:hypothetical protein